MIQIEQQFLFEKFIPCLKYSKSVVKFLNLAACEPFNLVKHSYGNNVEIFTMALICELLSAESTCLMVDWQDSRVHQVRLKGGLAGLIWVQQLTVRECLQKIKPQGAASRGTRQARARVRELKWP